MSRRIIVHDEARFDVIDIAYAISDDNVEASIRFIDAIDAAYRRLSEMPGVGALRDYANPRFTGMRMWPVTGFEKYLIFYQSTDEQIRIIRVLHGARDLTAIFAVNPEP